MKERIYRGQIPFVRFLAAFVPGILSASILEPHLTMHLFLISVTVFTFLLFIGISIFNKTLKPTYTSGIILFTGIFLLGWLITWNTSPNIQEDHFSNYKSEGLVGVINEQPKNTGTFLRFQFKVIAGVIDQKRNPMSGLLLVNLRLDTTKKNPKESFLNATQELSYGDVLVIPSTYRAVSPPYNPNEFDYQSYLESINIWQSTFLEKDQYKKLETNKGNPLVQYAIAFRQKLIKKFETYLQDRSVLSIASALVLGYRNEMEKEVTSVFTDTGTVHVLAVSGLHVGIVFVVFSALLFWMNRNAKMRFLKGVVLILLIWFYALVTGFSPSVLRAAIMISFTLVSLHFVKGGNIYNTIAASAFMLLFYNPKFIYNVGFQLSYLAVIAIIYLYPKLRDLITVKNQLLRWLWNYMALSIAAQIVTFPLVIYYFDNFPLYFLPANLFIIVPATLIVYLGFALLVAPTHFLSHSIGLLLENLILFSKNTLVYLANLPYSSLNGFSLSATVTILLYCLILSFVFAFTMKRKKLLYSSLLVMIIMLSMRAREHIKERGVEQLRFYNVNRSLAIGVFKSNEQLLYCDTQFTSSKSFQYLLDNIELEKGKDQINIVGFPDSYRSKTILIEKNVIQVKNKRVLILDRLPYKDSFIKVDILLIRNNIPPTIQSLLQHVKFDKLLIDGSNSDTKIQSYIAEAQKLSIPYYVLKNNFAYVW